MNSVESQVQVAMIVFSFHGDSGIKDVVIRDAVA